MSDWGEVLREIDDDYLVGISNKGIVKRAYKDMETVPCKAAGEILSDISGAALQEVFATDEEIVVNVGEETVHIKMLFGGSTCSCPSRSICRHVVLGILALKEAVVKADSRDAGIKDIIPEDTVEQIDDNITESCGKKVLQQIAEYPTEKLCKKLGTRRLQELIGCARAGRGPQIHFTSVVTVQPIAKSMTVKLLFPLEHSTCTCHKKEFCVHKAEALLWCKLESGQLVLDELERGQAENSDYDMAQIRDVVSQMQAFLGELLDTGLSRTPQDTLDRMERLATICHNAKLPNFESDWRRLQDSCNKYLKRVASIRIQMLLRQITTLYRRTEFLMRAQNGLEVSKLAGAFRAEYTPVLDLNLVGIAAEHFVSKSGYEGSTVYFLEKDTKKWYTYTQARPVFYDNAANTANCANRRYTLETPWGLPVPLMDLAFWQLHLEQARCDGRGRLSSGKDTKGHLVQDRRSKNILTTEVLGKWYYKDFAQLFREQFMANWNAPEVDIDPENTVFYVDGAETADVYGNDGRQTKLVFLCPESCDQAVFLDTEQKLCMNLYDVAGKAVVVEVVYSKDEAGGIEYLEKVTNENLPIFFGKVYLRGGIIRMYPIAVFEKKGFMVEEA